MSIKKFLSIIVFSLVLVSVFAPIVKAETVAGLQAQIARIQVQIAQIKSMVNEIEKELVTVINGFSGLTGITPTPTPTIPTPVLPTPKPTIPESSFKCPDINNDGKVDMMDTAITAKAVNTCSGNASYNALADVNGDNCITMTDVNYVAKFFGQAIGTIAQCKTITQIQNDIAAITNTISQLTQQVQAATPTPSDSLYKCPDINNDGKVDMMDTAITAKAVNTCSGNASYNALGDVNGDNCVNSIDVNYVAKFFGKAIGTIAQCTLKPGSFKCPDINNDGKVDSKDIAITAKAADTCSGSASYNALVDFNGDNCITSTDIDYVASFFGKAVSAIAQCL